MEGSGLSSARLWVYEDCSSSKHKVGSVQIWQGFCLLKWRATWLYQFHSDHIRTSIQLQAVREDWIFCIFCTIKAGFNLINLIHDCITTHMARKYSLDQGQPVTIHIDFPGVENPEFPKVNWFTLLLINQKATKFASLDLTTRLSELKLKTQFKKGPNICFTNFYLRNSQLISLTQWKLETFILSVILFLIKQNSNFK